MAQPVIWMLPLAYCAFSCSHDRADAAPAIVLAETVAAAGDSTVHSDEAKTVAVEFAHIPWNELIGQFEPALHPEFDRIPPDYTSKPDIYLRREVLAAFARMHEHASRDGIELRILSATRTWDYQRMLWERKWNHPHFMGFQPLERAKQILSYSAMPGASRHHWGTDIDLNSLENEWFETGSGLDVHQWLQKNAQAYGFHQVYGPQSNGRTGYREEKWHWSYMPLASLYLDEMTKYNQDSLPAPFSGFSGAEWSHRLRIVEDFIQGIEPME